jgi:hypothetical protein
MIINPMAFNKRLVILFVVVTSAHAAFSQKDDCELTLSRASDEFNAGHFYIIPSLLSPCLNQFTREQSQRAYLLLTQTYLLLDDPTGAKQSYLGVLKANPEFVTDTALHSIDVIYLSKRFTATSIFSWFGKIGSNVSMPRVIYDLNTFGENVKESYILTPGYQVAVGGDVTVTEKISARAELLFLMATYKHRTADYFVMDKKELTDRQMWLSLPLTAVYADQVGKYRPYGYLGYSFQYLLADRAGIVITNNRPVPAPTSDENNTPDREDAAEESPTLDLLYKRNRWNQAIVVGGGLKIKLGLDFLFVDVRYSLGLRNVVSEKNTYADNSLPDLVSNEYVKSQEVGTRYTHTDDYFRLDNLSLSVGFLRPLYKPRELRKARTKSVMRKLR